MLATADSLASNPHLYKLAFDPRTDFVPVVQLTRQYRDDYDKYARLIKDLSIKLE